MRKKYLLLFLLISLLLALTACSSQQDSLPYYADGQSNDHAAEVNGNGEAQNDSPAPEAPVEVSSVTVVVTTPSPEPTPAPTDTPVPTDTPEPLPTPFTFVWTADTQGLAQVHPDVLESMREYTLSLYREGKAVAFIHTGDVVDACGAQRQWDTVTEGLMPVVEEMTTFMAAGNHDQAEDQGEEKKLNLFNRREIVQKAWEGMEVYKQGEVGYRILELGGEKLLFAVVSYGSSYRSRCWLQEQLNAQPEIPAIIVTHSALFGDGRFTPDGNRLNQTVVTQCPSVRLVLCGHARGICSRRTDAYDDDGDGEADRTVTTVMCNFQEDQEKGLGYLRLVTFDPVSREISFVTYSPWYDLYTYKDLPEEDMAFTLSDAF